MKNNFNFKNFSVLSVLLVIFVAVLISSCILVKKERGIRIGIATWPGFATGYVGMEKGFFGKDLIVTTKILDNMPARHSAFQSGDIDIMISSADGYAQEAAQGITGRLILITDESWGGDGIVCSEDIKSPADLKGKKIAFARATPSHFLLLKVLDDAKIPLSDVELIEVDDPGRAGDAFLGGAVDAAVTWEPFLSQVVESAKGHILLTTKDYPDIIVDILVASDKLAANEELLVRFMDGWLKSVDYIKTHPKEAAQIMSKGMNIDVEDVEGMMAGLRYADHVRNAHFFDSTQPGQTRLANIFNDAGKYWQEIEIIEKPVQAVDRISPTACKFFQGEP